MQGLVSRIAVGVFGLLTVAMVLLAVFDDRGAIALREQRQKRDDLNSAITEAAQKNEQLRKEINDLRSDRQEIERRAREELMLVKPGEIVIQTPKKQPPRKHTPTKQQPEQQK